MKWTKERPTVPGKYWVKRFDSAYDSTPFITDVLVDCDGVWMYWGDVCAEVGGGWWFGGPIPEPEEASFEETIDPAQVAEVLRRAKEREKP